ncbi:MAG: sulfatase-like hydrolase/transferase [Bacteroidia bacterium]|nr:sulfatase-like hydrolase/transferase [Bacteroidia bacterium]
MVFILHRNPHPLQDLDLLFVGSFYGFKLDLAWMAYNLVVTLFITALAGILGKRWMLYVLVPIYFAVATTTAVVSFADAEMNRVWGNKFNSQALDYMKHPNEAMASSSEAKYIVIVLGSILIVLLFTIWLFRILKTAKNLVQYRWKLPLLAVLTMVFIAPIARGGLQTIPINQSNAYYSKIPFENMVSVNSTWNFLYYISDPGVSIDADALKFELADESAMEGYFAQNDSIPMLCSVSKPNVVLFVLESFSSHTSALFGKVNHHTPFLDSLAKTGLAFTHAYAQGDRTAKGLAAVLSGWPGQANQTKSILTLPTKASRLPNIGMDALNQGYKTMFFYGGDMSFDNMYAYVVSGGFTTTVDEANFIGNQRGSKWGAFDGFVFQRAIDSMNEQNQPFFTTILSLSSHEPFEIPGKINTGDEVTKFLNSVEYSDNCIREFMSRAAKQKWFNNTVFLFVADHGRKMGLPDMETYQPKFFQVPIVIWGPAMKNAYKGKTVERVVSQTDIPATLLESVLGIKNTKYSFSRNLLGSQPSISYYQIWDGFGVVSDKGHVIWNNPGARISEQSGQVDDLLKVGKAIQWKAAKVFEKL